jgi:hypothetical protein
MIAVLTLCTILAGTEVHQAAKPTTVDDADRAAAATTAGVGAFVGVTVGGVIVPGAASYLGGALGARPPTSDLVIYSTIGGAAGAGIGAGIGAIPTATPFLGQPVVALASTAGALAGLLPSLYFAKLKPATSDSNDPVRLAQSACLLGGVLFSTAAAAGTAALLAAPGVGR